MTSYIALLRKDFDSDYGVEFPDFSGCISAGTTLDKARSMAKEALTLHIASHIEGMIKDGERLPAPSSLETVMKKTNNREAVAILVDVPHSDPMVRVNITLPRSVLEAIGSRRNRSAFLAQAAMEKIERQKV
ncbi:type II toxin-antitoxin system HicB family antitoxin [Acetobacteraceae bacterium ESL0709]|nr:type II toxin-antitoxin system HicB family antitoxin [Acetobacteraceae bacterium ESL0697]MDF7677817.1 type II toxin-antitoxin system HicB family antitoxin [Acetobacteraceae bacterium ESL0709]